MEKFVGKPPQPTQTDDDDMILDRERACFLFGYSPQSIASLV